MKIQPLPELIVKAFNEIDDFYEQRRICRAVPYFGLDGVAQIHLMQNTERVIDGVLTYEGFKNMYKFGVGVEEDKISGSLEPLIQEGIFITKITIKAHENRFSLFERNMSNGIGGGAYALSRQNDVQGEKEHDKRSEHYWRTLQNRSWTVEQLLDKSKSVIKEGAEFGKFLLDSVVANYKYRLVNPDKGEVALTEEEINIGKQLVEHYQQAADAFMPKVCR